MKVEFTLTGKTPILFHADDVEASDELQVWRKDPKHKNISVAGDDRSPAWTWQSYLYSDGTNLVVPTECVLSCLRKAAAKKIMKRQTTYKEASQAGILPWEPHNEYCDFLSDGKQFPVGTFAKWKKENWSFRDQAEAAAKLGFRLFMKRAKIGKAKHVRVRARFDEWQVKGTVFIDPSIPELTFDVVNDIFEIAGRVGLLDWRPGSPMSPGPYGMFGAVVKVAK